MIEFLRAFVRPYLEVLLGTMMVALTVYLVIKFADREMAKYIVATVITAGVSLFSYYFGERSAGKRGQ